MNLRQYIQVMDALISVELEDTTTATDIFVSHPEKAYKIIEALSDAKDLKKLPPTQVIGMLEICLSKIKTVEPYEVPFIEVNGKRYTACEPLLMDMSGEKIQYGEMSFGNCLEAFQLLDSATHPHRAIPMVLAYVYEGEEHPIERAKELLDMDYMDAVSAHFFFARSGIGYITHSLSQQEGTTEHPNTKQPLKKQVKTN